MRKIFMALLAYSIFFPKLQAEEDTLYIGTYTGGKSQGIYRMAFDAEKGTLEGLALAAKTNSPSFLALDGESRRLYCVNEISNYQKKSAGSLGSFSVGKDFSLTAIGETSSMGAGPCHLSLHPNKHFLFAANYGGGSVCSIPIEASGRLGNAASFVQHKGTGPNKGRQEAPHAHSAVVSPDGNYLAVADLGLDKVLLYKVDQEKGTLAANQPPFLELSPGAGPRHMAFHPSGKFLFVVNEMDSTVTCFNWNPKQADFTKGQSVSTLPKGFKGNTSTAEIIAHPNGQAIYASNRGHNSIAVISFDALKGSMALIGNAGDKVNTPRNFTLHPDGKWLLVGNQGSDSISVFRVMGNDALGGLAFNGLVENVPSPVCLRFWPRTNR